jgi:predicted DNA-binding transcriptional regulator AlpA
MSGSDAMNNPPIDDAPRQRSVWTADAIRALGATIELSTVGQILGLSRNHSSDLARRGQFPVPVLPIGSRLRVATTQVINFLGIAP